MDPLSALSLAGVVVQFVTFSFTVLNSTQRIYKSRSGASRDCEELKNIYSKLLESSIQLRDRRSHLTSSNDVKNFSDRPLSLGEIAEACGEDCEQLLKTVDQLKVKSGTRRRWWQSFSKAILEVWTSKDLERLKT